jgi:hypothetical protein
MLHRKLLAPFFFVFALKMEAAGLSEMLVPNQSTMYGKPGDKNINLH